MKVEQGKICDRCKKLIPKDSNILTLNDKQYELCSHCHSLFEKFLKDDKWVFAWTKTHSGSSSSVEYEPQRRWYEKGDEK